MNLLRLFTIILPLSLAGCMAGQIKSDVSPATNVFGIKLNYVFGIKLNSVIDYKEVRGIKGTEEPCLKGFERSFEQLDIIIGYGFDKKIRKISTRNTATSLFGISPGIPVEEGKRLALKAGFTEISPIRFRGDDITLSLLVDEKGRIFGLIAENLD